jgi:hypothetical protein
MQFQNRVCCRYLRFQKGFDVDVLDFQILLRHKYFGEFFKLATVLATFKKLGIFSNLLVILILILFVSFSEEIDVLYIISP